MAKVLVTGGAGFIGSHLVDRLIGDGHKVIILDNLSTGKRENLNPKAEFIECDVADYEAIAPHFAGVEAVFHVAALARIQPSIKNPLPYQSANVTGTLNVLWASCKAQVKKVIYSSTSSIYGDQPEAAYPLRENLTPDPHNPYTLTKLFGEMYCQLFGELYNLSTVILRYFNVYGPRQLTEGAYATVIGIFLKQRAEGKPMTLVKDGAEKRRDFTHVSDVIQANILAWQNSVPKAEVFNIGKGKNYSVKEVTELIGGPIEIIPQRMGEYKITLADNTKARTVLGWNPKISLEEGTAELKKLYGL